VNHVCAARRDATRRAEGCDNGFRSGREHSRPHRQDFGARSPTRSGHSADRMPIEFAAAVSPHEFPRRTQCPRRE